MNLSGKSEQLHNVDAAAEIFIQHWDFIYAVIRFKVIDEGQVDDLFQNFFLSLVSKPPSPDVKNIKGYLYKAIINDIIDNVRYNERYQRQKYNYAEHLRYSINDRSSESTVMNSEEIKKMIECIDKKLEYNEAKAINLRYKNNYKLKEVAAVMGVNNTAAWRYISKGLSEIKRILGRNYLQ
jgi:RNA polymerase sigma factor (sigma-70 family)